MDATWIEAGVALGTAILALATFWMAWEVRQGRLDDSHRRVRGALRGALAEQLENTRSWHHVNPSRRPETELRIPEPEMRQMLSLPREVDLQADVSAYMTWIVADLHRVWADHASETGPGQAIDASEVHRLWDIGLDHLQVVTSLVAGELRRRGFSADAAVIDNVGWMLPEAMPNGRTANIVAQTTYLGSPTFPEDPAFAFCSGAARDKRAGDLSAARQASLLVHEQAVQTLLHH